MIMKYPNEQIVLYKCKLCWCYISVDQGFRLGFFFFFNMRNKQKLLIFPLRNKAKQMVNNLFWTGKVNNQGIKRYFFTVTKCISSIASICMNKYKVNWEERDS